MDTSPLLERYRGIVNDALLMQIYEAAAPLSGLHVLHINTTAQGGGVAEILDELIPQTNALGVRHSWQVVPLDDASSAFTARLVDMLQGCDTGSFPDNDKTLFLDKLQHAIPHSSEWQADLYFIHDFQLAPLAALYPWMRPACWFCHVDTANPTPTAQQYIRYFLDPYARICFSSPASVFSGLPLSKVHVVTLGIDPFRLKNCELTPARCAELVRASGVDPTRPLITQVSRFATWKNPWQAIDIYRLVKRELPDVQLAMVGAMEAEDNIKARDILTDLELNYLCSDPDIHLLSDANFVTHEVVNAFQRHSNVILQRSIREGFGLTVTEAMWKRQPVIGTHVTGLQAQINPGVNGFLVDETETAATCALQLLRNRQLLCGMGSDAHKTVKEHFLFPSLILEYLKVLQRTMSNVSDL